MQFKHLILGVAFLIPGIISPFWQRPDADSFEEAVANANQMRDRSIRSDYLVQEAAKFLNDRRFEDARDTAYYVLTRLDTRLPRALEIYASAQDQISPILSEETPSL